MTIHLLPKEGRFYKANLHTHTQVSDGCHTPEEIKAIYQAHGYSVVAFTDHDVMVSHQDLTDENFLALTAYEVYTNAPTPSGSFLDVPTYHLNFYAATPDETRYPCPNPGYCFGNAPGWVQDGYKGDYVRRYSVEGQNEMIAEANRLGYLVSYNYPDWSLQHYPDYAGLEGLHAVEVYNTGCVVDGCVLDAGDHVLDDFLNLGKRVFPIATDDNHGDHDTCGGWVRFKAPALTYPDILKAYRQGDFYASWGPDIESLTLEDGILHLTCTPVVRVEIHTGLRWTRRLTAPGGTSEPAGEFVCDLTEYIRETRRIGHGDTAYFRLVLTDIHGNRAMTRGYFLDELPEQI